MMRSFVALLICIASCAANGCVVGRGGASLHPHSELMKPTFCFHAGKKPVAIKGITILSVKWEGGDYQSRKRWELEYAPEASDMRARPFACITYGKPPPGYKETVPAQPLNPGTHYSAMVDHGKSGGYQAQITFVVKSDSNGAPVTLEYYPDDYDKRVRVITKP